MTSLEQIALTAEDDIVSVCDCLNWAKQERVLLLLPTAVFPLKSVEKELETIVLAHDLEEYGLKQGDIGAVVHVYLQHDAYEVEFVTREGETVAVLTLTQQDIRPIGAREILHVREIVPA